MKLKIFNRKKRNKFSYTVIAYSSFIMFIKGKMSGGDLNLFKSFNTL